MGLPGEKAGEARLVEAVESELISTDAEGRLVLADALPYAHTHYQPRAVIDPARPEVAAVCQVLP
jgi:hypothetical protein